MVYRSPGRRSPVPEISVTQAVLGRRRRRRPALVDATSGRTLTYASLTAAVWAAAAGLAHEGLRRGEVVAVHLPDSLELAVALHAVTAAGAVPTPVRPTASVEEMARQLADSGARMLITWPVLLDIALDAVKASPVDRVFAFGAEPDVEPFTRLFTAGASRSHPEVDPNTELALLPYTRGATGPSKGVRLTHRNVVAGVVQVARTGELSDSDVVLSGLPLTDVLGLGTVLNPALFTGASVVMRSGSGRHDFLRTLQDREVTVAVLTPEMVEVLAFDRAVSKYNLRSVRSVISVGDPVKPEAIRGCARRLRCTVRQGYGLAEGAGLTHLNLEAKGGPEDEAPGSVGRCLPWTMSRIVDPDTGADREVHQPGELWLRGPMIARWYADRPATGEDGWLRTGDMAFADDKGRFYVVDRVREKNPGLSSDPEAVLAAHPAVADAVVVPVPHPELGLALHAFVVLHDRVTESELLAHVAAHVQPYQLLHSVHVVDAIPRTPTGRVLRRVLIERTRVCRLEEGW